MRFITLIIAALALPAPGTGQTISTTADQTSVSLTVYNQDFAVVRETRKVRLGRGLNSVRFQDVAGQIDPTSISFRSLSDPGGVVVREQNYQYDVLNPVSILDLSVGASVVIRETQPDGSVRTLKGELISRPSSGGLAVRLADGSVVVDPPGEVELARLPDGLVPAPSLLWLLDASRGGAQEAEISYIAGRISWKADYVGVLAPNESRLDLTGWVTLDNRSGTTYRDARLQLMAGDVRRVQDPESNLYFGAMEKDGVKYKSFEEQSFFEYHLYTLEGTTTIRDNEQKQMTLLTAAGVGTERRLVFDGTQWPKVMVIQEIRNSAGNRLGMPLPKGRVRLYKRDEREGLQFVGEDIIDHTPRDETLKLLVGVAFDVVGRRTQTGVRKLGPKSSEFGVTITLRNHKRSGVTVKVVERLGGDWRIVSSSQPVTKSDASTMEYAVKVPANAMATLRYTARTARR